MLAAATLRDLQRRTELFERAARFEGRSRERMIAVAEADELFFRLSPLHYRSLQMIRIAGLLGRTAGGGTLVRDDRCLAILSGIIRDAVRTGDLSLSSARKPQELAFAMWAMAFGARALMDSALTTGQLGIEDPFASTRAAVHALLDAFGWRPYSDEWDYEGTRTRIRQSVLLHEVMELESRETTLPMRPDPTRPELKQP